MGRFINISRVISAGLARFVTRSIGPRRLFAIAVLGAALVVVAPTRLDAQGPPPGAGRPVELEGDLDVLYEDGDQSSHIHYFLDTIPEHGRRRVPLRFRGADPDLPSGSRVRVSGDLADDGTVTATTVTTIAVSAARTIGEQPVLVILFNFSNNAAQPYTPSSIDSVNAEVRDLVMEHSYRQTIMSFTVTGWHTIAASNATCDYSTWATLADDAATKAGFNIAAYARRIYAFPQTDACAWWGMGNLGGPRSYVNGTYHTRVVAHEQGHNFGNRHSHALKCDSAGCVSVDYGDDRDVMGGGGVLGHMTAFQKERIGWLNYGASPVVQTVTASNDYWIDSYATLAGNTKGLKIWNAAEGTYYYLEARAPIGFDANVLPGVTLHTGSPSSSDSSYQIDLDPLSPAWDSTLDVGQTVTDTALGVSFATLSSSLDGALVRVTFGGGSCVTAAPGVSLSPATQTGAAGATLAYTLTVTNKNAAACAASPVTFSVTAPSGWTGSVNPASAAAVAPGASVSTTVSLTSPSSAAGSVNFTATAMDSSTGLSTGATGTAGIASSCTAAAPGVTLSPATQSGAAGATLRYTLTVTNRNSAACAASAYTFAVSAPSSWVSSFTPTSAASLASGASVSTTLALTSPGGASGSSSFTASAMDATSKLSASATGSAGISAASLTLTASAAVTRSGNSRTATFTVTVKSGTAAVPKAGVTVTVTTPTGETTAVSGTTDASGVATVKYSPKPKDPAGAYSAKSVVSVNGVTASATTSFMMP